MQTTNLKDTSVVELEQTNQSRVRIQGIYCWLTITDCRKLTTGYSTIENYLSSNMIQVENTYQILLTSPRFSQPMERKHY